MFDKLFKRTPTITVHLMIKGRIGEGWLDIDRALAVPPETTLNGLLAITDKKGIPLRHAIENSPHLAHTLMWNGERRPVDDYAEHALSDGDRIYLLAPLAGG